MSCGSDTLSKEEIMAKAPATTAKPRVSRLERIASGFTLLSALILGAYLLSRLNLLPLDPHVT